MEYEEQQIIEDFEEDILIPGDVLELRKKEEYLKEDSKCPRCSCYTLEYQVYGYEKNIFCTNCPYAKIITLS